MSIQNNRLHDEAISKKRQTYHRQKYGKLVSNGQKIQTFSQLQTIVNQQQQQHSLMVGKGCNCKVCAKNCQPINTHEDHYLTTNPDSYLNLFSLLQHLTMIQAEEAPRLLGNFPIPMFFFKRQMNSPSTENKTRKTKAASLEQPSFVVFKNNLKTGFLQHPFLIKSFSKLAKLIQTDEQTNRKLKNKQRYNDKNLTNLHDSSHTLELTDSDHFVHTKHFQESIPSYVFPSPKFKSLQSVHKYILHQEDRYIKQQSQDHKLKKSQPFCIFRYNMTQKQERVSKCELFTIQKLGIYERKRQVGYNALKVEERNLNLVYVQSYTKIKTQEIKSKVDFSGKKIENKQIQTIYFSQFSIDEIKRAQLSNSLMFQLAELQIKLKLHQVSRIDPNYLNSYELDQKIQKSLSEPQDSESKEPKTTNLKFKRLSIYKTYKIVAILRYLCQVKVQRIKIKWMLNDHDQLVLLECLQYQIEHNPQSLGKRNKKSSHSSHILKNGLDYLKQHYNIEDLTSMLNSQDDMQELIRVRGQEKQRKNSFQNNHLNNQNTSSYKTGIKKKKKSVKYFSGKTEKLSRSTPFCESISSKKIRVQNLQNSTGVKNSSPLTNPNNLQHYINGYNPLRLVRDCKFYINEWKLNRAERYWSIERQKIDQGDAKNTLGQKINLIKLIRDRYSFNKKSYRLKPFKTEQSKQVN